MSGKRKTENGKLNWLAEWFENHEPKGRWAWLGSTYEAFHTFAFTPNRVTRQGCHVRDAVDLKRAMITVVIALIPAMLFGMWNIGYQTALHSAEWPYELGTAACFWYCLWFGFLRMLPMLAVSYIVGLTIEFAFAQIRHHQVNEGFLVTGFLIPMIVPVTTPLWQLAIATAFAVIIGKEAFGGTGMNFLNPALVARAFLFFAYPTRMSGDNVWIANDLWGTDAIAGATPLGVLSGGTDLPIFNSRLVHRHHPGFHLRDLGDCHHVRRHPVIDYWHRQLAHHTFRAPGRRLDGIDLQPHRCQRIHAVAFLLPLPDGRIHVRCGLHGHRPRDSGTDQHWQMDLWTAHRSFRCAAPCGQPCLP